MKISTVVVCAALLGTPKALPQTSHIVGRVETSDGQRIAAAAVTLNSVPMENKNQVSVKSESDGTFRIPLNWKDVNMANASGATWTVAAAKEDYSSSQANVLLVGGRVEPEMLVLKLSANPFGKYFALVDGCPRSSGNVITMYVFDLKAVKLDEQTAGTIPEWLSEKLDAGIRAHLESYKLLGDLRLQVRICGSFPVKSPEAAQVFGQRLGTPAVLWGDVVGGEGERLTARIKFTSLLDSPITDITAIQYSKLDSLYEPRATVHKAYIAFASFVLGKIHLKKKNTSYALRCFNHAKELNALPHELANNLKETLAKLELSNVARGLTPVSGGSR